MKTVVIGADHAGVVQKNAFLPLLASLGYRVVDVGAVSVDPNDDYPDIAAALALEVSKRGCLGILLCGSGAGMCIAANKVRGIRAAQAWTPAVAKLLREDNDANVLCVSARTLSFVKNSAIVKTFLSTNFSRLARHTRRVKKIATLETV